MEISNFFQRNRQRLVLLSCGLLALGSVAWWLYDRRYPSWDEEVLLSDGRVITIHQKHEFFNGYGTNQSWVTIDLPELGGKRVWHSYLIPMRVDVHEGNMYVFGRPRGPRQVQFYQYPKNNIVAFKWVRSEFIRIPYISVPEILRVEENVLSCIPRNRQSFVTVNHKSAQWCDPSGDSGQFVKRIDQAAYRELAIAYARLDGGKPISD